MRILKIVLMVVGGVGLCAGFTCAYLVYQHWASTERWLVRFPEHVVSDPRAVAAVRRSLLARAASLQSMGEPNVSYQGAGEFVVELSARVRPALVSSALSDPGEFWIRSIPRDRGPSCDDSAPAVIGPGSIEEARVGFNRNQEPVVEIRLTVPAGESFREHSRRNVGSSVSLCLGERLLLAPTIRGETGRYLRIDGLASTGEASRVAAILNGGSIPKGASARRSDAA